LGVAHAFASGYVCEGCSAVKFPVVLLLSAWGWIMSGLGSVLFRRGLGGWSSGIIGWNLEVGLELDGGRVCLEGGLLLRFEGGRRGGGRREEENGDERDER